MKMAGAPGRRHGGVLMRVDRRFLCVLVSAFKLSIWAAVSEYT